MLPALIFSLLVSVQALAATAAVEVGKPVAIGDMSYEVRRAWWDWGIPGSMYGKIKPDGVFLIVEIEVRNRGSAPAMVGKLTIFGFGTRLGDVHSMSQHAHNALRLDDPIGPGLSRRGVVAFDIRGGEMMTLLIAHGDEPKQRGHVFIGLPEIRR